MRPSTTLAVEARRAASPARGKGSGRRRRRTDRHRSDPARTPCSRASTVGCNRRAVPVQPSVDPFVSSTVRPIQLLPPGLKPSAERTRRRARDSPVARFPPGNRRTRAYRGSRLAWRGLPLSNDSRHERVTPKRERVTRQCRCHVGPAQGRVHALARTRLEHRPDQSTHDIPRVVGCRARNWRIRNGSPRQIGCRSSARLLVCQESRRRPPQPLPASTVAESAAAAAPRHSGRLGFAPRVAPRHTSERGRPAALDGEPVAADRSGPLRSPKRRRGHASGVDRRGGVAVRASLPSATDLGRKPRTEVRA